MSSEESTLHLEDECNWKWCIPNVSKGVDHFLGHLCYSWMPADLCFCVVSTLGGKLEMITLSLRPFLLYVFDLGRPSDVSLLEKLLWRLDL